MRGWVVVVVFGVLGLISPTEAQIFDTPSLRGSSPFIPAAPRYAKWEGAYIGGQVGFAGTSTNFSTGAADLIANILRNTTVQSQFQPSQWARLPAQGVSSFNFGAFIGYNFQYEDAVVGVELNYNRANARMGASNTVARVVNTSDGYSNNVTVSGSGSLHLTDYATLRFRGGWANDTLMPYGFLGVAVGRATVTRSASVSISGIDADPACAPTCLPPYTFAQSQSDSRSGAFGLGWTAGTGIDWAFQSGVFVRGEFEYVAFPNFRGVAVGIAAVHAAAGVRF